MKKYSYFLGVPVVLAYQVIACHPYITGNAFKTYADFVLDDVSTFVPSHVAKGNVLFVKTDLIKKFFEEFHPYIAHPYILITHNSDHGIPNKFLPYLKSPKLMAWFAKNALVKHSKLHPIPIGIPNQNPKFGNVAVLEKVLNEQPVDRDYFLYVNFHTGKGRPTRPGVWRAFYRNPLCTVVKRKPFEAYLRDLKRSVFVLSPQGSGFDCHRTWEALLCGCYPIVEQSGMDCIFDGLPVVLVRNWNQVTEEFLQKKYKEFSSRSDWQWEKLLMPYWLNLIDAYKT